MSGKLSKQLFVLSTKLGVFAIFSKQISTGRLVHAFFSSRLNNCNSLFYGFPSKAFEKLKGFESQLPDWCLAEGNMLFYHTNLFHEFLWLGEGVIYKIALPAYNVLHDMAPS